MKKTIFTLIGILVLGLLYGFTQGTSDGELLYIGTYSQRGSEGIYVFHFDREQVKLKPIQTVTGRNSPSFLAIHPNRKSLYAVYREGLNPDTREGSVAAFEIGSSGKLTKINEQSSEGIAPCHISVDPQGEFVYVSNYVSGSIGVYPVKEDGALGKASDVIVHEGSGPNPDRQKSPHMHSVIPAKNGKFVYASDLGTDEITAYMINRNTGTLSTSQQRIAQSKPGSGPRHFDIHPNGEYAYSVEELTSTIAAYSIDQTNGSLRFLERESMLPPDYTGNNTGADIQVSPDGRFVYASNRGHNSLAIFSIDMKTGKMTPSGHASTQGERPRNFLIDRKGEFVFVANRNTDDVVVFRRNKSTGALDFTGEKVKVPAAVCVKQLIISH